MPETINEAKRLIADTPKEAMLKLDENYSYKAVASFYGEVEQRWLIVFSRHAYERESETFERNLRKQTTKDEKSLWHLCNQEYACEADAIKAVEKFNKKLKYHEISYTVKAAHHYHAKGRPSKNGAEPVRTSWKIEGTLIQNKVVIENALKRKGVFIIATNEIAEEKIDNKQLLEFNKAQGVSVERGFRFLKDPLFYASEFIFEITKKNYGAHYGYVFILTCLCTC